MEYTITRAATDPVLDGQLNQGPWAAAPALAVASFHARSSPAHRPVAVVKALYDAFGMHVTFAVRDRYVRAVRTGFQDPVCRDACVEFFVQPGAGAGYFNFELSLAGGVLVYWITDARRIEGGFAAFERVRETDYKTLTYVTSKPGITDPESEDALDWWAGLTIPWTFFGAYLQDWKIPHTGAQWRGNFYKCADESSHPHWASWTPIGQELNFHQPDKFGALRFA